jgi:hypothetical protein
MPVKTLSKFIATSPQPLKLLVEWFFTLIKPFSIPVGTAEISDDRTATAAKARTQNTGLLLIQRNQHFERREMRRETQVSVSPSA